MPIPWLFGGRRGKHIGSQTELKVQRRRGRHPQLERLEPRQLLTVEISEFMASNRSTLPDQDGDFSDWIELHNRGAATVDLTGWHLTDKADNLTKWRFPSVQIPANGQLVVFASEKDRRVAGSELHTNFKLDAAGEPLALVRPDGTTVEHAYVPAYPAQTADVSYGLSADGLVQGYFPNPTPGQPNAQTPISDPARAVVISEIMYSLPQTDILDAENVEEEFIELHNRGFQPIDVTGWQFTRGIRFTLPSATIPAGGYLVVAADLNAFAAKYPAVPSSRVVGGWTGSLANSGETLELVDDLGLRVDQVRYADEGDWAVRDAGPLDRGSRGWVWSAGHNAGNKSLELVNRYMTNDEGQNWRASQPDGGTPGSVNSVDAGNLAPMILDVIHSPAVPRSSEPVTVTARLLDESMTGLTAQLRWRIDGEQTFRTVPMVDNGQQGDQAAGDGIYGATIGALPNLTVVEFYVEATDGSNLRRTWPAPTASGEQLTNALYQVFNNFDAQAEWQPGAAPIYFQIMTAAERQEFTNIDRQSDAQFNATFIAASSAGIDVRYNTGIRIRGSASRNDPIPANRIRIPSDRPWEGLTRINVNARAPINQIAGSALFRLAGVEANDVHAVKMYSNGVDLQNGFYVHAEVLDSQFAENHYPLDSDGNIYRGRRPDESPPGGQGAGLVYFGEDPLPYVSYVKNTNSSEADWSDVITLTRVLNTAPNETYVEDVEQVANVEQWFRALAMNQLIDNNEAGLFIGDRQGDDYAAYRGIDDPRFQLIPYDWDTLFGNVQRSIFRPNNVPALNRMITHPDLLPRYYGQFLDLIDNTILTDDANLALEEALRHVASENQIANIKTFLSNRAEWVRSQINGQLTVEHNLPIQDGLPKTSNRLISLGGLAPIVETKSVEINGMPAASLSAGVWSTTMTDVGETTTIVPANSTWKYLDDGIDQGTAWRQPQFNDTGWQSGNGQLGYGDGDEATTLNFGANANAKHTTYYFRNKFNVADPSAFDRLVLELIYDDGAAVYLNGTEVVRANLTPDATFSQLADTARSSPEENEFVAFQLSEAARQLLVAGENVLAVEVHQASANSSDLSFDVRLLGIEQVGGDEGLQLSPGLTRVRVDAFDGPNGTGNVIASQTTDIWYDDGDVQNISGSIATNTIWRANDGPFVIGGEVTIAAGATLTIEPGTTVFFDQGARLTVRGTLRAIGSDSRMIRFTRLPGTTAWQGIQFIGTMSDNRIEHAIVEYGVTGDGMLGLENSQLTLEHVTLDHTDRRRIRTIDSSLVVRNSVFTTIFEPGVRPTTDNQSEHIWGRGIPANGQWIVEGNTFGHITGHNDSIDFDAPRLPNPIPQIRNNLFLGGGDDALDMTGDVYIEGNTFRDFIKDRFNTDPGESNTISSSSGDFWVVRNVFENVQHASIVKEGAFMHFLNNTVVGATHAPLYFDLPGQTSGPGRGARVEGSIFAGTEQTFDYVLPTTDLTVYFSFIPDEAANLGFVNQIGDPHVADRTGNNELLPGSFAKGYGPKGIDMGAKIPDGAIVTGLPDPVTPYRTATLQVGGPAQTHYRYRLDQGAWSGELPIDTPIQLSGLGNGPHSVAVVAKDILGNWQSEADAYQSRSWTVDPTAGKVRINEVLADNLSAYVHDASGSTPDVIELYNSAATVKDLSGFSISDSLAEPRKFVFPAGTTINARSYLVLAGGNNDGHGLHLGFSLDRNGESLFLFDKNGQQIDSIDYGLQIPDYSIGIVDQDGNWGLTVPTIGGPNRAQPVGDAGVLKINEWYSGGEVRIKQDFVELYNPDQNPVPLGGLHLTDERQTIPSLHTIAPLSFIAGQGFTAFTADGDPEDGNDHVDFRLSPIHDHLGLLKPDGTLIDQVFYATQTSEFSQGRVPDGAEDFEFSRLPTPGAPNEFAQSSTVEIASVGWNDVWRYNTSGQDLGTAWRELNYDDVAWESGPGPLGNENEPLPIPLSTTFGLGQITYYFRHAFEIDQPTAGMTAEFYTLLDDGAVVYINGQEVLRLGLPEGPIDAQTLARNVNEAQIEGPFAIPSGVLVQGQNIIAVEVHQQRLTSSDLVFGMDLSGTVTVMDGSQGQRQALLNGLRISELMYHPADEAAVEFIEVINISDQPLDLTGVRLDGAVEFTFPPVKLPAGARAVVAEDTAALLAKYGAVPRLLGQYSGNLGNGGDEVALLLPAPYDTAILRFEYDTAWQPSTDGGGKSLEIVDPARDYRSWSAGSSWRASTADGGTPGFASGESPIPTGIVINEVLTHTDLPLTDSIELYNRSGASVNLSGWMLTDSVNVAHRYRIPASTNLASGAYIVFDEDDFNPSLGTDPLDFALDGARGDRVWLWQTDSKGELVGIVDYVEFGAAANGESYGRSPNGIGPLLPMSSRTLGSVNSVPRVGPVVISEVNYHPTDPSAAAKLIDPDIIDEDLEFIELYNSTNATVDLTNWRIRKGADFDFAPGTQIGPKQALLVVNFDPANAQLARAFRTHYNLSASVPLVGGFAGRLNNSSDSIQLQRPDEPPIEDPTFIPRLLEDQVTYADRGAWPTEADGNGASLTRKTPATWGDLPSSWTAEEPTPGRVVGVGIPGDFNGDQVVDIADVDLMCLAVRNQTPGFDLSGNGIVDQDDLDVLIEDILGTTAGDANLDGRFDSKDFITVFLAGEYEDNIPGNSTWAEGDWNCDGEFTSRDMITAFLAGSYEAPARPVDAVFADASSSDGFLGDIRLWLDNDELIKKGTRRSSADRP